MTMDYVMDAHKRIQGLIDKVKELEEELERKDEMHLKDLTLMRDQMQAIMNKHCLN